MYRPAIIIQKSEQKNLQLLFREIRCVKQDNKENNYQEFFALKCVIQRRKLSKYFFVKSNALNGTRKKNLSLEECENVTEKCNAICGYFKSWIC